MNHDSAFSRRDTLKSISSGFGYLAFAGLAHAAAEKEKAPALGPLDPKDPHFAPRAKRVIFLCMRGAPSHVDTFDYKPKLTEDTGAPAQGPRARGASKLLGSPWEFSRTPRTPPPSSRCGSDRIPSSLVSCSSSTSPRAIGSSARLGSTEAVRSS